MKAKKLYAYAFMVIFVLATCASACSGDNDEPTPKPEEPKREVSYVIDNGNGGGSTTAPTVVTKGTPLNMTISQKSSYTDSDGKVFSCEPKATISLKVVEDTVHVKDLIALTSVKQKGNPSTSTNGTNPAQTKITQVFEVAGQEVAFDLGYEVYRYINTANQTIEMPYIKLNPAAYGAVNTDQNTRGLVAITSVRLTPITPYAATRGEIVGDTAMYKVSVSFNVEMQTQNTGNDETTPLVFETEFVGIVESATELPDPTISFDYHLNILGGTTSTTSPFAVTLGEEFSLEWTQNSQYTYFSATELNGKTVGEKPKATVKMLVAKDTLWANSVEELEKVNTAEPVETASGENPVKHTTKQSFNIGGKIIDVDWIYEAYAKAIINGQEIELPYLELGLVEVANVTKTEITAGEVSDKTAKVYEVMVTLRQSLKGKNTPNDVSETVEYVVKYIAAVEVKLISTTYERDYEWAEPKYNLHWRYTFIIKRIRTYSTGEQETDTFWAPTCWVVGLGGRFSRSYAAGCVYHNTNSDVQNDDFRCIRTTKTGVPNINYISWENFEDVDTWSERNLRDYTIIHYTTHFDPENPIENWYHGPIIRRKCVTINYDVSEEENIPVIIEGPEITYSDVFLYLDGQVIDFSDYRMTYDFDFSEENTALSDGSPAKVFTHECKAKYLGKDFYVALVDTVYQLK